MHIYTYIYIYIYIYADTYIYIYIRYDKSGQVNDPVRKADVTVLSVP
jgi:hypothetical protein